MGTNYGDKKRTTYMNAVASPSISGTTIVGTTTVRGATVSGTSVVGSATLAASTVGTSEVSATVSRNTTVYSNPLVEVSLSAVPIFYASVDCTVKEIVFNSATTGSYITGNVSGCMFSVVKVGTKGCASAGVPVISKATSCNQTPISGNVPWSLGTVNSTSGGLLAGQSLALNFTLEAVCTGFPYFTLATTWEPV